MIDHVILTVSDFKRSVAFYAKALKPLGITAFADYEGLAIMRPGCLIPTATTLRSSIKASTVTADSNTAECGRYDSVSLLNRDTNFRMH